MTVTIDIGRCIGAGQCVLTAPRVFDQGDAGTVELLEAQPPPDLDDAVRAAEHRCPVRAITVTPPPATG